jgi:CHAD domain-containing protein
MPWVSSTRTSPGAQRANPAEQKKEKVRGIHPANRAQIWLLVRVHERGDAQQQQKVPEAQKNRLPSPESIYCSPDAEAKKTLELLCFELIASARYISSDTRRSRVEAEAALGTSTLIFNAIFFMGFHLEKDEPVGSGFQRILLEQATRLLEDVASADKDLEEAIHEVRKRCKRVRSVARLLRPHAEGLYRQENATFRNVARGLSPFRDADVRLKTFDELVSRAGESDRFAALRKLMRGDDHHGQKELLEKQLSLTKEEAKAAQQRFENAHMPNDIAFKLIEPGLRSSYKRGRRAMSRAFAKGREIDFHEWRKRVKDLGYQMRILRELWPALLKRTRSELDKVGDLLGEEHDLTIVRNTAVQYADSDISKEDLRDLLTLAERRKIELQAEAQAIGRRVYAERPRDFVRRIQIYWRTWHGEIPSPADRPVASPEPAALLA